MNKGTNTKILNKTYILFTILLLLIPTVVAINYPQLTGYVTDNANIITPEYKQKITDLAERINKNTTVEIAVLTIESLEGDSPENYAVQTFRQNGVGKKENNNGLLILVSKNDRKYRFEVGYGLEATIPDAMKVPIGDKIITPNFKNGEYGKGIYESMLVIEGLVTNNTEVLSKYGMIQSSGGGGGGGGNGDIPVLLFIGILIIIAIIVMYMFSLLRDKRDIEHVSPIPTYKPPPYTYSGQRKSSNSSSRRSSYSSGSISHRSSTGGGFGGGGFKGFGGGKSGGGGFGGGW